MTYPEFFSPFVFSPKIPIRWYGLMYIVGIISSCLILYYSQKKGWIKFHKTKDKDGKEINEGGIFDMVFYGALGAIIGARIGYFVFYSPETFFKPWEILGINLDNGFNFTGFAGMSFHGGFIGMFIAIYVFTKKYKYDFYSMADCVPLVASVCLFFGRIGNFMNAELYGRITSSIFAMRFPMYDMVGGYEKWIELFPALRPYTEPRHPSQLYEALLEGLVLAIVSYILSVLSEKHKSIRPGTKVWVWITLYGLFRTIIEEFAREITEWETGYITSGSVYSIPMVILGVSMLIYIYTRKSDTKTIKRQQRH